MKVVGFNFRKISVEKDSEVKPGVKVNTNIEIKEVNNEIELKYAGGLIFKLNRLLYAGIEIKGSENGHYWGPTISHGTPDIWFSLGSAFSMGTVKEDKPKMEIRMIIGVGLK